MARVQATDGEGLGQVTKWALAIGCAITVANIYYSQPLLEAISRSLHIREEQAGFASTLSQIGYAIGMLLIVPLGDLMERRKLIMITIAATVAVCILIAIAPSFSVLCVGALLLGISSCTPQILVPLAAALSKPAERGRVVGFVMSGLLLGILLARTLSGIVGEHFGWRTVFVVAAVIETLIGIALYVALPHSMPESKGLTYRKALTSLPRILGEEPVLRESMIYGACMFGAFSAFWTTLAFHLKTLGYGADIAGLFGLVGAAGALAAPIAGRLADQGGPRKTLLIAMLIAVAAFAIMIPGGIIVLVAGVLLMDVGVQAAQVTNQSRFYALRPEARNRLNTIYMTAYFVGGSAGSAIGTWAWSRYQWAGVCWVGIGLSLMALGNFWRTRSVSVNSPL